MNGKIAVAIDGPSGAGKSTLAKQLAAHFNFIYVDTGAIYRTVGLAAFRKKLDRKDEKQVDSILDGLDITIKYNEDGLQCMYLNGEDVSSEIRRPEISICASDVSALPSVRSFLLQMQRGFAETDNVVMDGRDIGTVVLPDAEIKIYLTASAETRARRRLLELQAKGLQTDFNEVLQDIQYRDYQDTHRDVAPLRRADDAVLVDTSQLTLEESFETLKKIVENYITR